jgi:peptide methionine sulfoxide reductase msrA/msrB
MFLKLAILALAILVVIGVSALRSTRAGESSAHRPANDDTPTDDSARNGPVRLSEAQWRRLLGDARYEVMRRKGTERANTGMHRDGPQEGIYRCAGCGQALFDSDAKFESGTGWPSFYQPHGESAVAMEKDDSHGMVRTEVHCSRCNGHVGHVFDDGPAPTGLRFCMNSVSLSFQPKAELDAVQEDTRLSPEGVQEVMFAAGCFWRVEQAFRAVEGVVDTAVGYSGGWKDNPTYREVCTDLTGHAEVVRVTYDPATVSFEALVRLFWKIHDPTQVDRQGPDVGRQYRSAIFYHTDNQKATATRVRDALSTSGEFARPVSTEIAHAGAFWKAEEYHQRYYEKTGIHGCGIK